MDELPGPELPAGDTYEFSDDEVLQPQLQHQSSRHGSLFSTLGSSDMAQIAGIDRNEYSDEDIRIVYEIVVRAQTILAEELTPSSRLPTHALFLAYDEILAEYGLDPSERHISKLVFVVGGVKGQTTLLDKFKAAMARMNIVLDIEGQNDPENEREHRGGQYIGSGVQDLRAVDDGYAPNIHGGEAGSNDPKAAPGRIPSFSAEPLDIAKEELLADMAEAFRKRHHVQFLAVATLRRWRNTAQYINYLCAESDTTRAAESKGELRDKFYVWRVLAAAVAHAAPDKLPPNAFSKRTEAIAVRAYEIYSAKKALIKWRQSTEDEHWKCWDAKLLADQLARQECADDDFKENPRLARLAQRTHRNLVLSRAFTTWSNRAEEGEAKAEVAAKAYEMSLKAKALGLSRKRSTLDEMRNLLASKTSGAVDSATPQMPLLDSRQPKLPAPVVTETTSIAEMPIRPHPQLERQLSSVAIATQLQTNYSAENRPISSTTQPAAVIPIATALPVATPFTSVDVGTCTSSPPVDIVSAIKPTEDANASDDDQPDERTMLARRHILRMRYFGAWERYISETSAEVEQFKEARQNQRVIRSISIWRDQATSRQRQVAEQRIEFAETRSYHRAMGITLKWRERARREANHRETVLGYYAGRAEYYQKATKALPILKKQAEQAGRREELLQRYAERTNYYLRSTQAISIWRERTQGVSQKRRTQEYYGERADYYYRTRNTLITWQHKAKQKRKERLKEAHLETRRTVKRGMGERCITQWRDKLEPSYQRYEIMNAVLVDTLQDREWRQALQAFTTWRVRAKERADASATGDIVLKQRAMGQWREKAALHEELKVEAEEHWEIKAKSRALKNWNLGSLQGANRPEMAVSALEKRERKALRQGFEAWYSRAADKLVPIELPDGTYRNMGQVVEGARRQATEQRARGILHTWRAATAAVAVATAAPGRTNQAPNEAYAPTPGRPQLLLGSFGRETTTPLAPVPSYAGWLRGRDSTMRRSEYGTRAGRPERAKAARNLRVSWAA